MTEEDIIKICYKHGIEIHKINSDMSIDVDGDVNFNNRRLTELPLKFNKIGDYFDCSLNNLTSLEGCPNYVGTDFKCSFNNLTSLEHCPSYVGENFSCTNNKLTTLRNLPMNFYVGGDFYCDNTLNVTEYGRLFFGTINGEISTDDFRLDKFLNKNKNPPKKDLPRLLSELRKIQL